MTLERRYLTETWKCFSTTDDEGERGNQLALKWHLFCISAAFTMFTHVLDGGSLRLGPCL